jgi:hypothetical protein
MDEDIPAPAMFGSLPGMPDPLFRALYGLDEFDGVAPRQSCNNLLHNFALRKRLGERPHIFQISRGKPGHLRKVAT